MAPYHQQALKKLYVGNIFFKVSARLMDSLSFWVDHQFPAKNKSRQITTPFERKTDISTSGAWPTHLLYQSLHTSPLFGETWKNALKISLSITLVVEPLTWEVATGGHWTLPIKYLHDIILSLCKSQGLLVILKLSVIPILDTQLYSTLFQFNLLQNKIFSFKRSQKSTALHALLVAGPTWPVLQWVTCFSIWVILFLSHSCSWMPPGCSFSSLLVPLKTLVLGLIALLESKLASASLFYSTWKFLHM